MRKVEDNMQKINGLWQILRFLFYFLITEGGLMRGYRPTRRRREKSMYIQKREPLSHMKVTASKHRQIAKNGHSPKAHEDFGSGHRPCGV